MRILLVNRFFGGSQTPTGRMLHDLANRLADAGHRVIVLTSGAGYVASDASLSARSLPRFDVRLVRQAGATSRLFNWGWFWLNAMLRIPFMRWDRCVLLTDPPFLVFAAPLAKLVHGSARRIVWWTMDLYPEALHAAGILNSASMPYRMLRRLTAFGLSAVDGVVALGPRQKRRLEQYRQWKPTSAFCITVPPWDNRPLPKPLPGENPVAKRFGWMDMKIALYAGNLGEGHTFEEFVAAARYLQSQGRTDWRFVFAVRGSRVTALNAAVAALPNVKVMDYLPESDTAALLWSATVHLISMRPGWEGIIVPSKLYGVMQTEAPVLFVGPIDADLVEELRQFDRGNALPPGSGGQAVATAMEYLAAPRSRLPNAASELGIDQIAEFVTRS